MTRRCRPPDGVLAWVLDDDDRTRRARSLLYPIAVVVIAVAALVVHSPAVGAISGLVGLLAGTIASGLRRRLSRNTSASQISGRGRRDRELASERQSNSEEGPVSASAGALRPEP